MEIKDNITPELERIKRELQILSGIQIHVGIQGAAGYGERGQDVEGAPADLITIAGVHEFGATIKPKNVKNLAIPIAKKAVGKSPKEFEGLFFMRSEEGYLFGCISPKRKGEGPKKKTAPSKKEPNAKKSGKAFRKPQDEDIEFLFLLMEAVNIPERSFIRAGYDNSKGELEAACQRAIEGVLFEGWKADKAANYVGQKAVGCIWTYVQNSGNFKAKSSVTLATAPGNSGKTPLYVTGRLRDSITYRIEGETI